MKANPYIEFLIEESRWVDEFGRKVVQPMLAEMAKKVDEEWGNMTDRDTFAAAALTGLIAEGDDGSFSEESYVRAAYRWADAMLAARTPPVKPTLTEEERNAIRTAEGGYFAWRDDNGEGYSPERIAVSETLRKLLERLG